MHDANIGLLYQGAALQCLLTKMSGLGGGVSARLQLIPAATNRKDPSFCTKALQQALAASKTPPYPAEA
jgi:hypothetical protein